MNRPSTHYLFIFEGVVLGIIAVVALIFFGIAAAYSVLLGAALVILPQLYFAKKLFRHRGAKFSKEILKDFYTGEALKMLLTFSGFAAAFSCVRSLNAAAFMLSFATGQLLFWFAPLLLRKSSHLKSMTNTSHLSDARSCKTLTYTQRNRLN
ncbi:MAG: ATP synthase subunit I [Endozoicomonadaceae bacterium]|nr:ATP synthase subunit I [Endozoicomonadaceae bacterium]